MESHWENPLAELLTELCDAQQAMIDLLTLKRRLLVAGDIAGMQAMQSDERSLVDRLQACHQRRQQLLEQAAAEGRPSDSIRSLAASLPSSAGKPLTRRVQQAASKSQLLQHHGIVNWVIAQRTMLHLSQMLEIIATGGRAQPTYGKKESAQSSGSLVDQAA